MSAPFDLRRAIPLHAAAGLIAGKGGRRPHEESLRRWATRGCRLPDGGIAVLKTTKIAGTRFTTPEWIRDFNSLRLLAGMAPPRRARR